MEELFAYAVLCIEGFNYWNQYKEKLEETFVKDSTNEILFDLEDRPLKDSVIRCMALHRETNFNELEFGKFLFQTITREINLDDSKNWCKRLMRLSYYLPESMISEPLFFELNILDDYIDEEFCNEECTLMCKEFKQHFENI